MEHQILLKIILTAVGLLTTAALTYTGRAIVLLVCTTVTDVKDIISAVRK